MFQEKKQLNWNYLRIKMTIECKLIYIINFGGNYAKLITGI